MRLSALALTLLFVASGCSLRPRYNDFGLKPGEVKEARFVVLDAESGRPVEGAKVEVSEFKNRVISTTGADGTFVLPVEKKYVDENPLFVVTLPRGVLQYRVELVHEAVAPVLPPEPAEAPVEAPAPVESAPEEDVADAGTTSSY